MTASQLPAGRKTDNTSVKSPVRPIAQVLLELAYLMHATKVVGVRETPAPSRPEGRSV